MKNKKKNGFIATSLMFSFFLIFLTMSLMIMATYTHYQGLINSLNSNVLNDLNDNVIVKKYVTVKNSIMDGDMVSARTSFDTASWTLGNNTKAYFDNENQITYIRMYNTNSSTSAHFSQRINSSRALKVGDERTIYVRYNLFRNGYIPCNSGRVTLRIGSNSYNLPDQLCGGDFVNWESRSAIFKVPVTTEDVELIFDIQNMYAPEAYVDINTLHVEINNVMVIDVSDAYMTDETSKEKIKNYFDANVPYFDLDYSIKKI